jgi:hypothetical protein
MRIRNLLPVFIFLLAVTSLPAFAQSDSVSINTIVAKTEKFLNDHPSEKVYLHMDKPYYAVADTIWFKAYLTVDMHQPSPLSKIVYIEILAHEDSLVQTIMLPVQNSVASAGVPLLATRYQQGNYRIRAYTKWMMNSDPAYFFNKTISIGDAVNRRVLTNITFKSTANGKVQNVDANINFKDESGVPLANRRVNWTVQNKNGIFLKGKGTTDANGNLTASLTGSADNDLKFSTLTTIMEMADRKTRANTFSLKSAVGMSDIQFFPEGGTLLNGVKTKVAFKAINNKGLGVSVKGIVTDNDGKQVATCVSQHLGMGAFTFTPEPNKTYKAAVTFSNGTQSTVALPQALTSGMGMTITDISDSKLAVTMMASDAYFQANKDRGVYIIAQTGGVLCYAAKTVLNEQSHSFVLPRDKYKTGVMQITIFAANGDPLCERLYFVWHPTELMNLTLTTDKKLYARRSKVSMTVSAKNQVLPVEGNFSVAVIDETKTPFNENAETTILTSMLLQADLRGYIEKPSYYFIATDKVKLADLDVLMLTQGYRQIVWKSMFAGQNPPVYFLPEQGIELSGTLRNGTGMPIKGGNVRLQISTKNTTASATTNVNGVFKFSDLSFSDSSQITFNARGNVNANSLMIMADNPSVYPGLTTSDYALDEVLNIDSTISTYLKNSKKAYDNTHMLKDVVIKSTVVKKVATHADYPALTGLSMIADHVIDGDRLTGCGTFLLCMQSALAGVTYQDEKFYITRDFNAGNKTPMSIFVKGMPVDANYLNSINPAEVESVEVFLKDELGTVNRTYQTNGVIVINYKVVEKSNIKFADIQKLIPPRYIANLTPKGYYVSKEFYSPKYAVPSINAQVPDLRTTIYWNPNVNTEKATGTAKIEYYNADGRGTYKAVMEGMDKDGNIGRYVYRYKVE